MDDLFLESNIDIKKTCQQNATKQSTCCYLKWHLTLLLGNDTIYDANYCYVLLITV